MAPGLPAPFGPWQAEQAARPRAASPARYSFWATGTEASLATPGTAGWAAFNAGQTDRALQLLRDARLLVQIDLVRQYLALQGHLTLMEQVIAQRAA